MPILLLSMPLSTLSFTHYLPHPSPLRSHDSLSFCPCENLETIHMRIIGSKTHHAILHFTVHSGPTQKTDTPL